MPKHRRGGRKAGCTIKDVTIEHKPEKAESCHCHKNVKRTEFEDVQRDNWVKMSQFDIKQEEQTAATANECHQDIS